MPSVIPDAFKKIVDFGLHATDYSRNSVNGQAVKITEHRYSGIPRFSQNADMENDIRSRRLAAFEAAQAELERTNKISSLNDWCRRAQVGWSTVKEFITGDTQIMSDRTYEKLAIAVGWTVARLKGEPEPVMLSPAAREYLDLFLTLSEEDKNKELRSLRARYEVSSEQ